MKILWFTWKDRRNPLAGGAEVVNEELGKRLAADGHEVIFLVGGFPECDAEEVRDGFRVIRVGGKYTVFLAAFAHFRKNLKDWPDIVIDEVNTVPFFAKFYCKQKNFLFFHQLSREIWFYEIFFPLTYIGYIGEPIYLWMLAKFNFRHGPTKVLTISESTKRDLMRFGFKDENISIISVGIEIPTLSAYNFQLGTKFEVPTMLSLGAMRAMKHTGDIVQVFEIAKESIPELELVMAGDSSGAYGAKVLQMIETSKYRNSIKYLGRVSAEDKVMLMQKAHVIAVASVKEGWGLIVTEAASQGTPAVVYNVDGLRDSVRDGITGMYAHENTPQGLAGAVVAILGDNAKYHKIREAAWNWSKEITFENCYKEFKVALTL